MKSARTQRCGNDWAGGKTQGGVRAISGVVLEQRAWFWGEVLMVGCVGGLKQIEDLPKQGGLGDVFEAVGGLVSNDKRL